jgi:hypothetical protein
VLVSPSLAAASLLLLWMNRSGRVRPEFVDEQHCRRPLLLVVLSESEPDADADTLLFAA